MCEAKTEEKKEKISKKRANGAGWKHKVSLIKKHK
jgi:hypothetical protein